jgi:outer membrane protein assembly factor BamB
MGTMRAHAIVVLAAAALAAADWPQFRGPGGQGISQEKRFPVKWSSSDYAWKTPVPGEGWSSPIVSRGRVFVTTATDDGRSCRALSLDAKSGRVVWDVEVFRQNAGHKERKNSYASPTPASDGSRVYVVCGDGSFAALDFNGKVVWANREFPHYSQHGLASSPVLAGDLLIMSRDGSSDGENKKLGWQIPWDKSRVLAVDKNTGKVRWTAARGLSRIGHTTPVVAGDRLFSSAGDVVQAFRLADGERLWSAPSQGEGVVPSIVIGDGLIYSASGFEKPTIRAHKTDGTLAWEQTRGVPMISSMIYVKPHLYSVTTQGIAWCFNGATGEPVWQSRLGGAYSASPAAAAGRIYFASEDGDVAVIEAGAEFKLLSTNTVGEKMQASPALSDGTIFLRTERHVVAVRAR